MMLVNSCTADMFVTITLNFPLK